MERGLEQPRGPGRSGCRTTHFPSHCCDFAIGVRELFVTVHDMLHIQPNAITGQPWTFRAYARTMLFLDVRRASRIFTPSHATAAALTEAAPSARVTVTPLPVDNAWFDPVDPGSSPVAGKYILYVGTTKWHKNLTVLVKAFTDVAQSISQDLVIAGGGESVKNSDGRIDLLADAHADRVRIVGRVDFEALRALVAERRRVGHAVPVRRGGTAAAGGDGIPHRRPRLEHPLAAGDVW